MLRLQTMPKNIVVCCDGTGNEFGENNSNVIKLYQALECDANQIAYYHPGVGTIGAKNALTVIGKAWTKFRGLAFGYGLSENIADAYQFLMQTFEPDDRIFIFVGSKEKGIRKEAWSRGKDEGRIVYRKVLRKDDPSKTRYHEHLAFEVSFDFYENQWYLAIKPDWFCSYDGYNRSFYNRNRVSFLKRNDHNDAVLDDLLYITEILQKDQKEVLAGDASRRFITLGDLVTLDGSPPINDDEWLQQDEKRKRKALEAKELPLFSYEPGSNT